MKRWNLGSTQPLLGSRVCQGTKPPKHSCTQKNFLAIQWPQRTRGTNWISQGPSQPPQHWPTAWAAVGRGGAGLCREGHPKHGPACNCKLVRTGTSMPGRRGETWGELQVSPSCWAHLCWLLFTCFPASFHFPISRSRGSYFSITVTKPCNYLLALQFGRYYAVHCAKQLKKKEKSSSCRSAERTEVKEDTALDAALCCQMPHNPHHLYWIILL